MSLVPIERPVYSSPPCDVCRGVGWLKDNTSLTGQSPCPMCRGRRTNAWRQDVAHQNHQRYQLRQTWRIIMWIVIAVLMLSPIAVKGMWLDEIILGLLLVKFFMWLRRQNGKHTEGSLT